MISSFEFDKCSNFLRIIYLSIVLLMPNCHQTNDFDNFRQFEQFETMWSVEQRSLKSEFQAKML